MKERYEEQQWLQERLLNDTPSQSKIQGLVDFRDFVGFHNQSKIDFDPLKGSLETLDGRIENAEKRKKLEETKFDLEEVKIDSQIAKTQKRKELIEAELELAHARKNLNDFSQDTTAENHEILTSEVKEDNTSNPLNNPSPSKKEETKEITIQHPSVLESSQTFTLPSGKNAEKAEKVEGGLLDLFHDQLAFRNAVRASIREQQLDDRHDLFGSTLYDFQFQITLKPGNRSEEFAQVEVELKPPQRCLDSSRVRTEMFEKLFKGENLSGNSEALAYNEYLTLYEDFRKKIQLEISRKTGDLTGRYLSQKLRISEIAHFMELLKFVLPGSLNDEMAREDAFKNTIRLWLNNPANSTVEEVGLEPHLNQLLKRGWFIVNPIPNEQLNTFMERVLGINYNFGLLDKDEWNYDVGSKEWEIKPNKRLEEMQEVIKSIQAIPNLDETIMQAAKPNLIVPALAWLVYFNEAAPLKEFFKVEKPSTNSTGWVIELKRLNTLGKIKGSSGFEQFMKKLMDAECEENWLHLHTASVEPKELAQNISQVGARESFLSLISALQASLPQYGISGEFYTEYVRKTQEYIQAINRKPLAIGYAQERRKFGWILGPKFKMIEPNPSFLSSLNPFSSSSLVEFSHVPVRHTFRASQVIPAWWKHIRIQANRSWLNSSGELEKSASTKDFRVHLPRPSKWWVYLKNALLGNHAHPQPTIVSPNPQSGKDRLPVLLPYDEKDPRTFFQSILIIGEDLWRNPDVLINGLKAKKVEILSNMEGLLATFDLRPAGGKGNELSSSLVAKKGDEFLDLTVFTSGGIVQVPGGVVFETKNTKDQINEPSCGTPVKLVRSFVVPTSDEIDLQMLHFKLDKNIFNKGIPLSQDRQKFGFDLYAKGKSLNQENYFSILDDFSLLENDPDKLTISNPFNRYRKNDNSEQLTYLETGRFEIMLTQKPFSAPKNPCKDLLQGPNKSIIVFKNDIERSVYWSLPPGSQPSAHIPTKTFKINKVFNSKTGKFSYDSPESLVLEIPMRGKKIEFFHEAYPGLKQAAQSGKLMLKGPAGIQLPLQLRDSHQIHYLVGLPSDIQDESRGIIPRNPGEVILEKFTIVFDEVEIPVHGRLKIIITELTK